VKKQPILFLNPVADDSPYIISQTIGASAEVHANNHINWLFGLSGNIVNAGYTKNEYQKKKFYFLQR